MSEENNRIEWVLQEVNKLTESLGLHGGSTFQSLEELEIKDLFEIHRTLCHLPVEDLPLSTSPFDTVSHMITDIKVNFSASGTEFNHLDVQLIVDKDVTQLKFLLQVFQIIFLHNLKNSENSKRSSDASSTLTSLTNSSNSRSSAINSSSTSGPESSIETWDEGSSNLTKDSSEPPDSSVVSDSGNSTAISDDPDLESTHSTNDEIVINVELVEDTLVSDSENELESSMSAEEPLKVSSNVQLIPPKIEFDKQQMLMVQNVEARISDEELLSISAIDSVVDNIIYGAKPRLEESIQKTEKQTAFRKNSLPPEENLIISKSTTAILNTKFKIESKKTTNLAAARKELKRTKTRIIFGPNASRSQHPSLSKPFLSRVSNPKTAIEEVQPVSAHSSNTIKKPEEPSETVKLAGSTHSITMAKIDSTDGPSNLANERSPRVSLSKKMRSKRSSSALSNSAAIIESPKLSKNSQKVSELDSSHLAVQGLLRDYLSQLEDQIEDLRSSKSSSNRLPSQAKAQKKSDRFGKPVKEKFPYYPLGIIYPKCKSIMGNGIKKSSLPRKPFQTNFSNQWDGFEDNNTNTRKLSNVKTSGHVDT